MSTRYNRQNQNLYSCPSPMRMFLSMLTPHMPADGCCLLLQKDENLILREMTFASSEGLCSFLLFDWSNYKRNPSQKMSDSLT